MLGSPPLNAWEKSAAVTATPWPPYLAQEQSQFGFPNAPLKLEVATIPHLALPASASSLVNIRAPTFTLNRRQRGPYSPTPSIAGDAVMRPYPQ